MGFLNELKEHKELLALLSAIAAMITALIARKKIVVHQIEYTTKETPPLESSRILGVPEPSEGRYDPARLTAYEKAAAFLRSQLATFATVCGLFVVIFGSIIAYQKYVVRKNVELDQPMIAFGVLSGVYFVILVIPGILYYLWHRARLR